VLAVSLVIKKPSNPEPSALFAIFTTQSNDFAIGYPMSKNKSTFMRDSTMCSVLSNMPHIEYRYFSLRSLWKNTSGVRRLSVFDGSHITGN
jgi:hypothetical protein